MRWCGRAGRNVLAYPFFAHWFMRWRGRVGRNVLAYPFPPLIVGFARTLPPTINGLAMASGRCTRWTVRRFIV